MDKYFFGAIIVLIFLSYLNHEAHINVVKEELTYKLNEIVWKMEDSKFFLEAIAKNTFDTGRKLVEIYNKRDE